MKRITTLIFLLIASYSFSQTENLQITYLRDLNFQQIIPGVKKTITEVSPQSGKFTVTGNGTRMTVSISFNLSQNLSHGSFSMPVAYTATYSNNANDNQPGIPFSPYAGITLTFDDKTREYYIKLGGTISPTNIQYSGDYTDSMIIILTILSN
jgi:hypothetical protein